MQLRFTLGMATCAGCLALAACGSGAGQAADDGGATDAAGGVPGADAGGMDSTSAGDAGAPLDGEATALDGSDGARGSADDAAPSDAGAADSASGGGPHGDASGPGDAGAVQALGVPMYVDPSAAPSAWSQVVSAAPIVALLVANPDSGPGAAADSSYTQAIATAHAAGQTVIGYVHTSYGARAIAQVEADIDGWYSFYPAIDGIFSDETSTDTSTVSSYYAPLYAYVKAKSGTRLVAINPGTMIDESFMSVGDVVVTFEDTYANYTGSGYPGTPSWVSGYSPWRFWHLVLSAGTTADLQQAVSLARQRNAGYVYVTSEPPATAYQNIVAGAYWQGELAAVGAP